MLGAKCVGANFEMLLTVSFNISVGYQHSKDVTNIEILSPKPENQHPLVNIYVAVTFSFEQFFENIF